MKFETVDELNQKVAGSICMVENEGPYYIVECGSKSYRYIDRDGNELVSKVDPRTLNFYPPRLGNIQIDGRVFYVSRNPSRTYRVGLSRNNVSVRDLFGWNIELILRGLEAARDNVYPFQRGYLAKIKEGYCVALSRRYSIDSTSVYFRGKPVAKLRGKTAVFSNPSDMNFHMENLMSVADLEYSFEEKKVLVYEQDDI